MSILTAYFSGLSNRKLLVPYCKSCGKPHFYPRHACPACWGEEYEWKEASGKAKVVTHTRVLANPPSAFEHLLPFEIAIVELDEGVSMLTNIINDDNSKVAVGDRVELQFVERDGQLLPTFRAVKI